MRWLVLKNCCEGKHKKLLNHLGKYFVAVHHSCSSCALVNIAKNLDVDQTVLTVKLNVDGNILQFQQKTSLTFRKWVERFEKTLKGRGKFVVHLALVIQKLDNAIHWINLHPMDGAESFTIIYLLDSNLSNR